MDIRSGETIMSIFKKEDSPKTILDFSPLELVTHVVVCLQLADGRIEFEEREVWADILLELFPDYKQHRALDVLREAGQQITTMDEFEKMDHAVQCSAKLKEHFSTEYLKENLLPKLEHVIEADGIVFTSETNMIERLKEVFK